MNLAKYNFLFPQRKKKWDEQLAAALTRVGKGEDVASEMKREYQSFLDSYHEQLLAASSRPSGAGTVSRKEAAKMGGAPIKPTKFWTSTELTKPGNMICDPNGSCVYVLDGWRTVCQLDTNGKIVKRFPLEIPEAHAVNQLRVGLDANGKKQFAGFSMLGKKVFVFDENWKTLMQYPSGKQNHRGISDCQIGNFDSDAKLELLVGFADKRGVEQVDDDGTKSGMLFKSPVKSFAERNENLLVVSGDNIVEAKSNRKILSGLNYRRVAQIADLTVALGSQDGGNWELTGLGADLKQVWTANGWFSVF